MGEQRYFEYDEQAIAYLKARDERLAEAIDAIGPVRREVTPDLFAALVNCIVGQQISTKAQVTIWKRLTGAFGDITPEAMAACPDDELQRFGLSFRKVGYIKGAAERVVAGELDLKGLADLPDEEVCRRLSALPGIGVWTAEMLMTFSMQRPDIMSYGDLAILRGLRMLHHHRRITPELFAKYRRRYSPYGSVASLYLWEIAGGAVPGLRDWAPKGGGAKRPRPGGAKGGSRGGLNGRLTIVTVSLLTCTKEAERVQFAGKRAYNPACPTVEPNAMVSGKDYLRQVQSRDDCGAAERQGLWVSYVEDTPSTLSAFLSMRPGFPRPHCAHRRPAARSACVCVGLLTCGARTRHGQFIRDARGGLKEQAPPPPPRGAQRAGQLGNAGKMRTLKPTKRLTLDASKMKAPAAALLRRASDTIGGRSCKPRFSGLRRAPGSRS